MYYNLLEKNFKYKMVLNIKLIYIINYDIFIEFYCICYIIINFL